MKKLLLAFLIMFVIGFGGGYYGLRYFRSYTRQQLNTTLPQSTLPSPTAIPTVSQKDQSEVDALFVPYWSIGKGAPDFSSYDELIYFGVAATQNGIDTTEPGYAGLTIFQKAATGVRNKTLALRMLDSSTNLKTLADTRSQSDLIDDTVALAQQKGFDGIVLDLEITAIPFDSLIKQIATFNATFAKAAKQADLSYSVMIYGDAFYRARPFDVKTIALSADRVMVMAYDFTKAKGSPGPGFPLMGSDTFGYDYTKMTGDFLDKVPKDKLAVTFGMFGYDWAVDDKRNATGAGTAVTEKEAMDTFVTSCKEKSCTWKKDDVSTETEVDYTGKDNTNHIVWFQSTDSAKLKKDYLKAHGISHFAYWAHSYF